MRLSAEGVLELAKRAVAATEADEAEVVAISTETSLTRFARNRIHQNVTEDDTQVSVRAVVGKRQGVASTNRVDAEGIARCAEAAVDAARRSPEAEDFRGLPGDAPYEPLVRDSSEALGYDAPRRAAAAKAMIDESRADGLEAAGSVSRGAYALAVANSLGVTRSTEAADVRATVLAMGESGSGWGSWLGANAGDFRAAEIGRRAAETAQRSVNPSSLEPGGYTVLLAPEAVSDLVDFMGFLGFGAKPFAEGSSFLTGHIGERLVDERVSILDDARSPQTVGFGFDFEGQPKQRTALIEAGVARGVVTDSYYAALLGLPNTGHALPAPNPYGPMPLNLEMAAGDATEAEMVASIERGVYVSRFHYVNVEEPLKLVLTGMTRDGTFLVENGEMTTPLRNQRFTQGLLEALSHVLAISSERKLIGPGEGGATLVPALLLERWEFTGETG